MTRAVVVVSLVLSPVLLPEVAHAEPVQDACRFQYLDHHAGWTTLESRREVICAFRLFDPSQTSEALYIADRESSFYAKAVNPYSGAAGLFQHLRGYWDGRVRSLGKRAWFPRLWPDVSPFNARANALITAKMVALGGWGAWS
jgi:hypothetical protein